MLCAGKVSTVPMFFYDQAAYKEYFHISLSSIFFPSEKPRVAPGSPLAWLMTEAVAFVLHCFIATKSFQGHYFLTKSSKEVKYS